MVPSRTAAENVGSLLLYEVIGGLMRRTVESSGFVFVALISNTRGLLRTMLGHLGMGMLLTPSPRTCVKLKKKMMIMIMKMIMKKMTLVGAVGPFVFCNATLRYLGFVCD